MLEIIQNPESKPDEEELFCLSLAAKLRKIKDPQKREYAQMQLQQTLYNCMYGDAPQPQPQQLNATTTATTNATTTNATTTAATATTMPQQFLHLWPINKVLLHQAYKVMIIP